MREETFYCDECQEDKLVLVNDEEDGVIGEYTKEAYRENDEMDQFQVSVYGQTVVKEFSSHIRIPMADWIKYKQQLIAVLKQGDMKDATGSNETRN